MKLTSNLSLKKPDGSDVVNIDDFNYNADKIDTEIQGLKTGKANTSHTHAMSDVGITTSSAVNSTSTSTIANSYAVKQAYDKGNAAAVQAETNKNNISAQGVIVTNQGKEIESLKLSVANGKTKVAKAITDKKVPTLATDTFDKMATNIASIKTGAPGWDLEEQGEVVEGDIVENDAIVWQKYGDWSTGIDPLVTQPSVGSGTAYIDYSPDGRFMACGSTLSIYKIDSAADRYTKIANPSIMPSGSMESLCFSPNSKMLCVTTLQSPYVWLYKIEGETFTRITVPGKTGRGYLSATFSPTSDKLVLGEYFEGRVYLFDINNTTVTYDTYYKPPTFNTVFGLSYSPDGKQLAISGGSEINISDKSVYILTLETGNYITPTSLTYNYAYHGSYSSDGKYYAVIQDRKLYIYSVNGQVYTQMSGVEIKSDVTRFSFSHDSQYIVATGLYTPFYHTFKLGTTTVTLVQNIKYTPTSAVYGVRFSPNGRYLYFGGSPTVVFGLKTKNVVTNSGVTKFPFMKDGKLKLGYATESKKVGEQIKVNLFPKLNIL